MCNNISFLTGINDPYLKFDKPATTIENGRKVIHLLQSLPMHCPVCGQLMQRNGWLRRRPVKIKILSIAGQPTVLSIIKQQYLCKPSASCPHPVTRVAPIQGIQKGCRIANLVKQHITLELTQNISQTTIARQHNVSTNTVSRALTQMQDSFTPNRQWLPVAIAFDDFKSGQFAQSGMSMILMNPLNHRTIDIIESRQSKALRHYFLLHYSFKARCAVKIVVVDLFQPYRRLIHELFPHAIIVADHFHVVVQAYRALQAVRIHVMNQYGTGTHEYRLLKRFWKLLMQKIDHLDFKHYYRRRIFGNACLSNSEIVDRLLSLSDDLKVAYEYYQILISAVNYHDSAVLRQLLSWKLTQLPQPFQKTQRTLRLHKQEIINSFQCQLTNGPIEGTNNKIKAIKRTAYGFRNFEHFRIRILLALKNSNLMIRTKPKEKVSSSSFAA